MSNQRLKYLHDNVRAQFLKTMSTTQLVPVAEELDTDDFADILQRSLIKF